MRVRVEVRLIGGDVGSVKASVGGGGGGGALEGRGKMVSHDLHSVFVRPQ